MRIEGVVQAEERSDWAKLTGADEDVGNNLRRWS